MGMAETSYNIRGRQIDGQELEAIREFILANESPGRTAISRLLCEQWRWRARGPLLFHPGSGYGSHLIGRASPVLISLR